jgi:hypothetical protein
MIITPSACRWCNIPEYEHGQRWRPGVGWHQWTMPTMPQIKDRMIARRAQRLQLKRESR